MGVANLGADLADALGRRRQRAQNIRAFILGTDSIFVQGLKSVLASFESLLIGESVSGAAPSQHALKQFKPDLILVDWPGAAHGRRETFLCELRAALPRAKIVVFSNEISDELMREASIQTFDAFLSKEISAESLKQALEFVSLGQQIFPTRFVVAVMKRTEQARQKTAEPLSAQESKILRCLAVGHSNKQIARELALAEATVKVHLRHILGKINAANRTQAAIWAVSNGFAGLGEDPV